MLLCPYLKEKSKSKLKQLKFDLASLHFFSSLTFILPQWRTTRTWPTGRARTMIIPPLTLLTQGSPTPRAVTQVWMHISEVCLEMVGHRGTTKLLQNMWSARAMTARATTLSISAMDLWSLTLSMCECATDTVKLKKTKQLFFMFIFGKS